MSGMSDPPKLAPAAYVAGWSHSSVPGALNTSPIGSGLRPIAPAPPFSAAHGWRPSLRLSQRVDFAPNAGAAAFGWRQGYLPYTGGWVGGMINHAGSGPLVTRQLCLAERRRRRKRRRRRRRKKPLPRLCPHMFPLEETSTLTPGAVVAAGSLWGRVGSLGWSAKRRVARGGCAFRAALTKSAATGVQHLCVANARWRWGRADVAGELTSSAVGYPDFKRGVMQAENTNLS